MNEGSKQTLRDLLIKEVIEGLSDVEKLELEKLQGESNRDESFEITASSLSLIDLEMREMPANLRSRVLADAERYFDETIREETASVVRKESPRAWMTPNLGWIGWSMASLAFALLAASFLFKSPTPTVVESPPIRDSIEVLRQQFLDSGLVNARSDWTAGNVKEIVVTGDVVWSDEKQEGYMTFAGLPKNDISKETYQLWIFDETQDPKTPIDGGTFDVKSDGKIVVPITAKLRAKGPAMFAITIEKPGGVVVSDRKRIAALAKVPTKS